MWGENVPTVRKVMEISSLDPNQANQPQILNLFGFPFPFPFLYPHTWSDSHSSGKDGAKALFFPSHLS